MPSYVFRLPASFTSAPVSVFNTSDVQQTSGTTDANATFTASLPVGDYYARVSYGYTSYTAAGEVARGDADASAESVLSATFARPRGNVVAVIGDSLFANGRNDTTFPIGENFFEYAMLASNGRWRAGHNGGVGGETSAQILTRLPAELALAPDVLLILAGANDAIQSVSLATTRANLTAMVTQCRTAGVQPVVCTLPPNANSAQKTAVSNINAWIRGWTVRNKVPMVDLFDALANPQGGIYTTGYDSGDGVHPTPAGMKVGGQVISDTLAGIVGSRSGRGPGWDADPTNLVGNGLFYSGTTTPTAWSVLNTAVTYTVNAIATDAAFSAGKVASLTVNDTGFAQFNATINSGFSVGDTLQFSCMQELTGTGGVLETYLVFNGASNATRNMTKVSTNASGWATKEFVVPTGTTSISVRLKVTGSASGATGRFGEVRIGNLTTQGVLS